MSKHDNIAATQRLGEAVNSGNLNALHEVFAPTVIDRDPAPEQGPGPEGCGVGFIASFENQASHELVVYALSALSCLEHRGGCSADGDSGDGAGLMTAIPWEEML